MAKIDGVPYVDGALGDDGGIGARLRELYSYLFGTPVLDDEEQREFLETLGLEEPGLNRLIREAYKLLGLQTYFTVGPKEARAWTIPVGATGPQAAGVIHTDFEKGFIRAETIAYADYVALKGEAGARDAGKMRAEGKSYVVKDGDVMHFRFNV
mgnify:CR=1 FL=1